MGEKNKNEKKDREEVKWGNGDNKLRERVTMEEEKKDSKHKKDWFKDTH